MGTRVKWRFARPTRCSLEMGSLAEPDLGVAWLAMTMSHTPRSSAVLHVACPAPSPCRMAGRHLT